MIILKHPSDLVDFLDKKKAKAHKIGFVPTMGALHDGHIALLNNARERSDITVCSIFVNPTQFNDPSDFRKYPNMLEQDIYLLQKAGADVLFTPGTADIYPSGTANLEHFALGYLETILEGKFRPGHFQGVCQVMSRLLSIVQPHMLFMGQKDYQQCMVIKKLIADLGFDAELIICPTIREQDGLAMSSRNLRLNPEERETATAIYRALQLVRDGLGGEPLAELRARAILQLETKGFRVDYVEVADAATLQLTDAPAHDRQLVILIAAFLNEVRLIDNILAPL